MTHSRPIALALGTAQFGLAYGVAGREEAVPEIEVRAILERAGEGNIRLLDTAASYGGIEARLRALMAGLHFEVVSKVGALPQGVDVEHARRFVEESIERSIRRLEPSLTTILFHRSEDLLGPHGDILWRSAEDASGGRLRLGVSCYAPAMLTALRRRYPIVVGQVPGNAFDQRLTASGVAAALAGIEIHVRSVFLQGMLLLPLDKAVERLPAGAGPLTEWAAWCARHGKRPAPAALAIARGLPGVDVCVVGVDAADQLAEIVAAWDSGAMCAAPALACESLDVIDPRRWS